MDIVDSTAQLTDPYVVESVYVTKHVLMDSLASAYKTIGALEQMQKMNQQQIAENTFRVDNPFAFIPKACNSLSKACPFSTLDK